MLCPIRHPWPACHLLYTCKHFQVPFLILVAPKPFPDPHTSAHAHPCNPKCILILHHLPHLLLNLHSIFHPLCASLLDSHIHLCTFPNLCDVWCIDASWPRWHLSCTSIDPSWLATLCKPPPPFTLSTQQQSPTCLMALILQLPGYLLPASFPQPK